MVIYDQGIDESKTLDCDLALVIYSGVCLAWDMIFTVVGCVLLIRHVIRTSQVGSNQYALAVNALTTLIRRERKGESLAKRSTCTTKSPSIQWK